MDQPISTTDNPTPAAADNPQGPAEVENGTGVASGQPTGAGPGGEIFKGIDPAKLPPEVKQHYDSMLRDYREKTGKLSETIKSEIAKATEAFKQKAELYDQVSQNDEFVKMWNDYVQKQNGQSATADPADPVAKLESEFKAMQQKIAQSEFKQVTDAFADAVDEKGNKVHPDFDHLNSQIIGKRGNQEYSLLRLAIELSEGSNPADRIANGYKVAKQIHDSIFEAGKKAGLGRVQAKVQNGTLPPSGSNGDVLTVTDKRPKSAREAMEMAKKGVVVSRD